MENIAKLFLIVEDTNSQNNQQIFESRPIYQKIVWYDKRSLLSTYMDIDYIRRIDKFYENVIEVEQARKELRGFVKLNREHKVSAIQNSIYNHALKFSSKDDNHIKYSFRGDKVTSNFKQIWQNYSQEYVPKYAIESYRRAKTNYGSISDTQAYTELRNLSEKRRKLK